jgi:peptidyl-prolyl cis-trans isomerase D
MIAVIAFALFAFIIGDLFNSGSFNSTSKREYQWKDISFEDFRIKVSNVEIKESLLQQQQTEFGTRGFCSFASEFDKLGLRVGENIY